MSAAINQVLDNELYGWTEVRGTGRGVAATILSPEPGTCMRAIEGVEGTT